MTTIEFGLGSLNTEVTEKLILSKLIDSLQDLL